MTKLHIIVRFWQYHYILSGIVRFHIRRIFLSPISQSYARTSCIGYRYCNILIKRFYSFAVDDPHNLVSWKLGKVDELMGK